MRPATAAPHRAENGLAVNPPQTRLSVEEQSFTTYFNIDSADTARCQEKQKEESDIT